MKFRMQDSKEISGPFMSTVQLVMFRLLFCIWLRGFVFQKLLYQMGLGCSLKEKLNLADYLLWNLASFLCILIIVHSILQMLIKICQEIAF